MKFILGKKIGMTTLYNENEGALNVTLIECVPNVVSLMRNEEKDGYRAMQLESLGIGKKHYRRELRIDTIQEEANKEKKEEIKKGDKFEIDIFEVGDKVSVRGITKAKGFQGVMKRHGFHGSPHSHGHKHDWRAPGSIGSAFPERVFPGKKMAGRMGGSRFTVKNLKVVLVDRKKNLLAVKGAVPGVNGRMVEIMAK